MTSMQLAIPSSSAIDEALTLPIKLSRVGPPRLDPYQRLLHRLYEPLFFLKAIGQTRGKHTPEAKGSNEAEIVRRSLLQALAYLCDFQKGGTSCTAIAVEETQNKYIFWVSTNDEVNQEAIAGFLRLVLALLQEIDSRRRRKEGVDEVEENLLCACVWFAKPRITAEVKKLRSAVERCQASLKERKLDAIAAWLSSVVVNTEDHTEQCLEAWKAAKSKYIMLLSVEARREQQQRGTITNQGHFVTARHYIGRLAHRIHAYRRILRHASEASYLLSAFEVRVVPFVDPVPAPVQDGHTTLHGILNRMLKTNDLERREVQETLIKMDHTAGVFRRFMSAFTKCEPVVHAEVKILEHFFKEERRFVQNDRFIACSKPACLCCKLYFQYHPARMVIPQSHEKVWSNWSPPQVASFNRDEEGSRRQLDVLNKMIEALRTDFINQILKCSQPVEWHADSQTGITAIDDLGAMSSDSWESETRVGSASTCSPQPSTQIDIGIEILDSSVKSEPESDRNKHDGPDDDSDDDDHGGVSL